MSLKKVFSFIHFGELLLERHKCRLNIVMGKRGLQVCARCRNHENFSPLKGHKRLCPFINCKCKKCEITIFRQQCIAKEIAIHRDRIRSRKFVSNCPVKPENITEVKRNISNNSDSSKIENRKNQTCARCLNHGSIENLKNHKKFCPHANCNCESCLITIKRREVMAKQIKDYRASGRCIDEINCNRYTQISSLSTNDSYIIGNDDGQFVSCDLSKNPRFGIVQELFDYYYSPDNFESKIKLMFAFAHLATNHQEIMTESLVKG